MKRRQFVRNGAQLLAMGIVVPRMIFCKKKTDNTGWHIEQFQDKGLAQFTYALLYDNKIILIDPARDAKPFYKYAQDNNAAIVGVIETHPHADFTSSHAEIQRNRQAVVYVSRKLNAKYNHHALDEGDVVPLNADLCLKILDTPGHSPDSISVILEEKGKDVVVFSGDALLFGDVGRPDLREYAGSYETQRNTLARQMYHTIHQKYAKLADDVVVYPAHGAGSLCGGAIRNVHSSTIGYERANNYAFINTTEAEFVSLLLSELPFIPTYFPYDVELNRIGAPDVIPSIASVRILKDNYQVEKNEIVIDGRPTEIYQAAYCPQAINIQDGTKFETWLGTVIKPSTAFYLIAENKGALDTLIHKSSKIGYEKWIKGAFVYNEGKKAPYVLDNVSFSQNPKDYTIIDVRNEKEAKEKKIFPDAINIPLPELQSRLATVPRDKPIVVHCASGYRSAIASSLLRNDFPGLTVLDLGTDVSKYESK